MHGFQQTTWLTDHGLDLLTADYHNHHLPAGPTYFGQVLGLTAALLDESLQRLGRYVLRQYLITALH